jgi:hypothetical protein
MNALMLSSNAFEGLVLTTLLVDTGNYYQANNKEQQRDQQAGAVIAMSEPVNQTITERADDGGEFYAQPPQAKELPITPGRAE